MCKASFGSRIIRKFLKALWDSLKTAQDKVYLLDGLNNYISNNIIQGIMTPFQPNINLDTLISSITWCPGNLVYGPSGSDRANDPKDSFDKEIYDAINNNTFKKDLDSELL